MKQVLQLGVGWAHGPTLNSGMALLPLLGHGPNLQGLQVPLLDGSEGWRESF